MLSKWRTVKATSDKMDTRNIVNTLSMNVVAGSDTTAIALRSVVYYTCRNPEKKRKLLEELDEADREGLLSSPVSYKESTTHLRYLDAVLKEAMRLHPSIGLLLERTVPPEGATICGVDLPGGMSRPRILAPYSAIMHGAGHGELTSSLPGTIVGINPWVLNYDARNFEKPEEFIPERWLEGDEAKLKQQETILNFNFGAGARFCMGKNISMVEVSINNMQLI